MGEMQPLFGSNCDWVGWISGEHIFDTDMNWVAYLTDGHAWSAETGKWLGPVNGGMCLDTRGQVVAWTPGGSITGTATPAQCGQFVLLGQSGQIVL